MSLAREIGVRNLVLKGKELLDFRLFTEKKGFYLHWGGSFEEGGGSLSTPERKRKTRERKKTIRLLR